MVDIEKVINAVDNCIHFGCGEKCTYYDNGCDKNEMLKDVLELLKGQEVIINNQSKCISAINKRIETLEKINAIDLNPKWTYVFNTFRKVVLCKDCIRKQRIEGTENIVYCPHVRMRVPVDWFCADGERKTE